MGLLEQTELARSDVPCLDAFHQPRVSSTGWGCFFEKLRPRWENPMQFVAVRECVGEIEALDPAL